MILQVAQIESKYLTHIASKKALVGDISDFPGLKASRMYDDACDEGIAIINSKTGNVTRWTAPLTGTFRDNELLFWEFTPAPESVRRNPVIAGYRLFLYND